MWCHDNCRAEDPKGARLNRGRAPQPGEWPTPVRGIPQQATGHPPTGEGDGRQLPIM